MKISLPLRNKRTTRSWAHYSSELSGPEDEALEKEKRRLREKFSQHYFQIGDREIKNNIFPISQFLNQGRADLIVPMREKGKVKNLLDYATKRLPPHSIFVINDESEKRAIEAVKKTNKLQMVDKEEILKIINWKKLLPFLNLSRIPQGKGVTVMAGYLLRHLLTKRQNRKSRWVFHTDADIENHQKFKALEYLAWGALKGSDSFHLKLAKSGRNNESHMAVRSALAILEDLGQVVLTGRAEGIGRRARELFEALAKYKWILSGTFGIPNHIAYTRPLATGYLEETLICAFVEDKAKKEGGFSVQISNPHPCADSESSFKKENIIVQMTANLVMILLLAKKPVCDWRLDDIAWINKNLMSKNRPVVLIPPKEDNGPVITEMIANERILPSIKMMEENGFINDKKTESLIRKYCQS